MKKSLLLSFLTILILSSTAFPQAQWNYIGEINVPVADTGSFQPFLCTVDANGRLYVISSKATNANAHNAIFYADSSDNTLKRMIDYDLTGDSDSLSGDIGVLRGISTVGTDVIINSSVPFPRSKPSTVGIMYYYPNGDTAAVQKYGFYYPPSNAGHGTYHHGVVITKDTIAVAGVSAGAGVPGPRPRFYNFTNTISSPVKGAWIGEAALDPNGAHNGGIDIIRDMALIPGGDYSNPETPFYTSRNSISSSQITGGVARWTGGDQLNPANYSGIYLQSAIGGELDFDKAIPYGITVDKNQNLWIAGTDSTRRWVKAFSVTLNFAQEVFELPSQNSLSNPDTAGAPMENPSDVALSPDALTAYVIDGGAKKVFKFKFGTPVSVKDQITLNDFRLEQNYPNPFNPSTVISYSLAEASNVKLVITNSLGETIEVITEGFKSAGKYSKVFNAENLSSGIYYYTLQTDAGSISKKMMLLK